MVTSDWTRLPEYSGEIKKLTYRNIDGNYQFDLTLNSVTDSDSNLNTYTFKFDSKSSCCETFGWNLYNANGNTIMYEYLDNNDDIIGVNSENIDLNSIKSLDTSDTYKPDTHKSDMYIYLKLMYRRKVPKYLLIFQMVQF